MASCRICGASRLIQFFTKLRGQVRHFGIAAQLQCPNVGNDGPAIARRNLCRVAVHRAKAVRDVVEEIAVRRLAETILMKTGRMLHPAHGDHAIAVTLQTVAGGAENLETVSTALEKFLIYRQRKSS